MSSIAFFSIKVYHKDILLFPLYSYMNQFFEKLLKKTLWLWLPFGAFIRLWKEVLIKLENVDKK